MAPSQSKCLLPKTLHNGPVLGHYKASRSFSNLAFPLSLPTPSSEAIRPKLWLTGQQLKKSTALSSHWEAVALLWSKRGQSPTARQWQWEFLAHLLLLEFTSELASTFQQRKLWWLYSQPKIGTCGMMKFCPTPHWKKQSKIQSGSQSISISVIFL